VRNIGLVLGVDALQGVLASCDRSISKVQCGGSVSLGHNATAGVFRRRWIYTD
jgi:hypothetical protein